MACASTPSASGRLSSATAPAHTSACSTSLYAQHRLPRYARDDRGSGQPIARYWLVIDHDGRDLAVRIPFDDKWVDAVEMVDAISGVTGTNNFLDGVRLGSAWPRCRCSLSSATWRRAGWCGCCPDYALSSGPLSLPPQRESAALTARTGVHRLDRAAFFHGRRTSKRRDCLA